MESHRTEDADILAEVAAMAAECIPRSPRVHRLRRPLSPLGKSQTSLRPAFLPGSGKPPKKSASPKKIADLAASVEKSAAAECRPFKDLQLHSPGSHGWSDGLIEARYCSSNISSTCNEPARRPSQSHCEIVHSENVAPPSGSSSSSQICEKVAHVRTSTGGIGRVEAAGNRGLSRDPWRPLHPSRAPCLPPSPRSAPTNQAPPVPARATLHRSPRPPRPPRKPFQGGGLPGPKAPKKKGAGAGASSAAGSKSGGGRSKKKASSLSRDFTTLLALMLTVLFGVLVVFQGFHANVFGSLKTSARGRTPQTFSDSLAFEHFIDNVAASSHFNVGLVAKHKQRTGGRKMGPASKERHAGGEAKGGPNSSSAGHMVKDLAANGTSLNGTGGPSSNSTKESPNLKAVDLAAAEDGKVIR